MYSEEAISIYLGGWKDYFYCNSLLWWNKYNKKVDILTILQVEKLKLQEIRNLPKVTALVNDRLRH